MRLVQHNGSVQATDHGLRVADVAHEHRLLANQDSTGSGAIIHVRQLGVGGLERVSKNVKRVHLRQIPSLGAEALEDMAAARCRCRV